MSQPALDEASFRALQRKLARRGTAWPSLAVLLEVVSLIGSALVLARSSVVTAQVAAVLLLTLALIHSYLLHHECVHRSVFVRDWKNRLLGNVLGFILLYPFAARRRAHQLHHRFTGHPERDPANRRAIARLAGLSRGAERACDLLWQSFVPFLVLNERAGLWCEPFRDEQRASRAGCSERRAALTYLAGYAVVTSLTVLLEQTTLIMQLFLPALALSIFVEEIVNLPHHADAPLVARPLRLWEQTQVTHSSRATRFWSGVILLHFNLHTAHHLFPWLPWYDLPRAQRHLKTQFAAQLHELPSELCWNLRRRRCAFRDVFCAFFGRPGERKK